MERRVMFKGLAIALGVIVTKPVWATLGEPAAQDPVIPPQIDADAARHMQEKIDNFDADFAEDIFLTPEKQRLMKQVLQRLQRAQDMVGFARFNLLAFDELLKAAANNSKIGLFTADEITFIEEIFFYDAKKYGFYGEKVTDRLTVKFDEKDARKIPGSGHYIFKGRPLALYEEIIRDVGSDIVLTSGIRSVVKQLHLFLMKAVACDGNLSRASRSLAPPGHSFHGISDFDVGKMGWGYRNFTDQFAKSDIFKRLNDLGYVDIRYTRTNSFGVRFEPWHIKVS
jgi:D-alanyl-D-alanine carboxypeptidase